MKITLTPFFKYAFGTLLAVYVAFYAVRLWPHADKPGLAVVLFVLSTVFIGFIVGLYNIRMAEAKHSIFLIGSVTRAQAILLEFAVLCCIIVLPALYRMSLFVE